MKDKVISAQGLRIDQVEISDVAGKLPEAGIDFEPNEATDRIVDVVIANSYLHDNHHAGLVFALGNLRGSSEPVSVRVERTRLKHNHHESNRYVATEIQMSSHGTDPVKGEVTIADCEVEASEWGVLNARRSGDAYRVIFRNLVAKNLVQTSGNPFYLETISYSDPNTMGGIHFENVFVEYAGDASAVRLRGWSTVTELKDLTGVVTRVTPGGQAGTVDEINLTGATRTNVALEVQGATAFP